MTKGPTKVKPDWEAAARLVDQLDVLGDEEGKLSECRALLDFAIELAAFFNKGVFDRNCPKLAVNLLIINASMRSLMEIPGGDGALHTLRAVGTPAQVAYNQLMEAEQKLKDAARLLGLPDDFYIRTTNIEARKTFIGFHLFNDPEGGKRAKDDINVEHVRAASEAVKDMEAVGEWTYAPVVEGETPIENEIRQKLAKIHIKDRSQISNDLVSLLVESSDNRKGAGGANRNTTQMAIRMIWDNWPKELRKARGSEWQPFVTASRIIEFCGHEASNLSVGKYDAKLKSKAKEKYRQG